MTAALTVGMLDEVVSHPELEGRCRDLYRRGGEASNQYRDGVLAIVDRARRDAWRRHGRPRTDERLRGPVTRAPAADAGMPPAAVQPTLFG